ncbi:MAG: hypothetical protein R3E83_19380 [Burkholderiaceae bacterium]
MTFLEYLCALQGATGCNLSGLGLAHDDFGRTFHPPDAPSYRPVPSTILATVSLTMPLLLALVHHCAAIGNGLARLRFSWTKGSG